MATDTDRNAQKQTFLVRHKRTLFTDPTAIWSLCSLVSAELMADMLELVAVVLAVMIAVVLELVVMVVVVLKLAEGVVSIEKFGTLGLGQVTSLDSSGQNSWIFSKRYHWRVGESPEGRRTSSRSVVVGFHSCFSRLKSTSGASDFSCVKTCPMLMDEK